MKRFKLLFVACFVFAAVGLFMNGKSVFAEVDVDGTYQMVCVLCHGEDGTGSDQGKKFKVPDFTNKEWQASVKDEDMIKGMLEGSDNPNYGEGVVPLLEMVGIENPQDEVAAFVPKIRSFGK